MDDSALFPSRVREGGQGVLVVVASSLSRMGGRVGEDKARSFGQGEASEREGHQTRTRTNVRATRGQDEDNREERARADDNSNKVHVTCPLTKILSTFYLFVFSSSGGPRFLVCRYLCFCSAF